MIKINKIIVIIIAVGMGYFFYPDMVFAFNQGAHIMPQVAGAGLSPESARKPDNNQTLPASPEMVRQTMKDMLVDIPAISAYQWERVKKAARIETLFLTMP